MIAASHGVTVIGIANFKANILGFPITDNNLVPISADRSQWRVGTFDPGFASTLGTLDPESGVDAVTSNFIAAGMIGKFTFDGLINGSVDITDSPFMLGGTALYMLVT